MDEYAERRGVSYWTVDHWVNHEPAKVPRAHRMGGRVIFKLEDVEAWESREIVPFIPRKVVSAAAASESCSGKRLGRPTKAEQIAKRLREGVAV